jgi:8-oxo-dGTP pyrophosphatase MutT (NUDIX family)
MSFELPRNTIVPVFAAAVRLDPEAHPFERDNAAEIEENWRVETARNPALFDGKVVLLSGLNYAGGSLEGVCHTIRFATFMLWRKTRPSGSAEHAYAHAMPVTSDNALILIRMAAHTVNAGRVYFAAGSFEPQDFREGVADIDFNMTREVGEETGLDLSACGRDPHYHLRSSEGASVIFRRYYVDEPAEAVAERIRTFVAAEKEPEIEAPVIVRSPRDLPVGLALHVPSMIEWHFANPGTVTAARPSDLSGKG